MAGTFPGFVGVQQIDPNGIPMRGATLSIYDAVTNLLVPVFSDYALSTPARNPLEADRAGRLPFVFVADGMYRLRLATAGGGTANGGFDYPSVPSIGQQVSQEAAAIDPTAIPTTGDTSWRLDGSQRDGWVRLNGSTIGNTYSGAQERSNVDCEALFKYAWNSFADSYLPVSGGRGVSANADWAANKSIALPSMRGRGVVGADGMGNTLAGLLTIASTATPDLPGSFGGSESVGLTEAQMPSHNHGGGGQTGGQSNDHTHPYNDASKTLVGRGGQDSYAYSPSPSGLAASTGGTSQDHHHAFTIPSDGGGQAHPNMPPFIIAFFYWKL